MVLFDIVTPFYLVLVIVRRRGRPLNVSPDPFIFAAVKFRSSLKFDFDLFSPLFLSLKMKIEEHDD